MRYVNILLIAVILVLPASLRGNAMAEKSSADETVRQEIEALIAGEDDAWARGDATGFAARALPDVVFTNILGMFSVGKPPFVAQHERIFATIYKGSIARQSIQHVTLLKPDVAIVDTLAILTGFQHTPPGIATFEGAIHARLEQVFVRRTDGWWVASFHNVAVNPAALQGAPPP